LFNYKKKGRRMMMGELKRQWVVHIVVLGLCVVVVCWGGCDQTERVNCSEVKRSGWKVVPT
jgi:hypothetical protein